MEEIRANQAEPIQPQEEPENDLTIENIAFSQYPVIKNIFSFLNPEDLETCSYVSKQWREMAESVVHYSIIFQYLHESTHPKPILLTKSSRYNRRNVKRYELNFEDVNNMFEEILNTKKVVLSVSMLGLGLSGYSGTSDEEKFLSKFGPLVQHLKFSSIQPVHVNEFSNFLLTTLPNLRTLDCSYLQLLKDSTEFEDFNPDLPKYQLKQLKKIGLGLEVNSYVEALGKFLKIGPNLGEIQKLPIWLINAVVLADKIPALKSIVYFLYNRNPFADELTVVSAFERLAQLQPKLSSFSVFVGDHNLHLDVGDKVGMMKPFVLPILQSSADSLRHFEIDPTEKYGYQNIPQLKGVKTLVFKNSIMRFAQGRHFPRDICLKEKFPNVSEVRFCVDSLETAIHEYLSDVRKHSWGSQIKRLQVGDLSPSSLPLLHQMFPLIEDLEFGASVLEMAELLQAFPKFWPQLKSMTINVSSKMVPENLLRPGPELLDCAFTGLSPEVVAQLLDPLQRGNFTDDQIEDFKSRSNISKLTELQQLTLELNTSFLVVLPENRKVFTRLTHVSYEFGFRLVPHLIVSAGHK